MLERLILVSRQHHVDCFIPIEGCMCYLGQPSVLASQRCASTRSFTCSPRWKVADRFVLPATPSGPVQISGLLRKGAVFDQAFEFCDSTTDRGPISFKTPTTP